VERETSVTVRAAEAEDRTWFEPLKGRSIDLSMGGLAIVFKGEHDFPVEATVQLTTTVHTTGALPIRPLSVRYQPLTDETVVRAEFDELTTEGESQLSAQLFGNTSGWTNEVFTFDQWWRSVVSVLSAIAKVGLGNPRWLQKKNDDSIADGTLAELVPGGTTFVCDSCGTPRVEGVLRCEACNHEHLDLATAPAPVAVTPNRLGIRPLVFPALIVFVAFLLAIGQRDVVQVFASAVPMEKWEKVTHQTRKGMLSQAYHRIDALTAELDRTRRMRLPLENRWEHRVWNIKRDYRLLDERLVRPETREIEKSLQRALTHLESCTDFYDPLTPDDRRAGQALTEARTALDNAATRLKIPH
jgi:hypothetical protein